MALITNTAIKECAGLAIFKDIGSNAFQRQHHLLVFFESDPSDATKQTLSTRLFSTRAAIFQVARFQLSFIPINNKFL